LWQFVDVVCYFACSRWEIKLFLKQLIGIKQNKGNKTKGKGNRTAKSHVQLLNVLQSCRDCC
jgi:hypothetical protein